MKSRAERCVVTTMTVAVETACEVSQTCCTGDPEPELVVYKPRDAVSILGVSLDLNTGLQIPVDTPEQLRSQLASLSSLPQGELITIYIIM